MQSFKTAQSNSQLYCHQPFLLRYVCVVFFVFFVFVFSCDKNGFMLFWFFDETNRGEDINRNTMRFSDIGDFHHSSPFFPQQDVVDLTSSNFLFFYMC